MNGFSPPKDLSDRLESFRKSDADREAFVQDLAHQLSTLQTKYEVVYSDFQNEQESRRMWHSRAQGAEKSLNELSAADPFVLVILDGDGAIFSDYLYALGKDGGADAARQLHAEIHSQLKATYPEERTSSWNVMFHLFLNLEGLAHKLFTCNIISHPTELAVFGRGFGLAQPLFNFIDVGRGKELADHKIRETLRAYMPITQCKHLFFGPCHDTGYLPVLETYNRADRASSRLTLIETRPAERGFIDLSFKRVRFPQIFRKDDLPTRPVPFRSAASLPVPAPPAQPAPPVAASPSKSAAELFPALPPPPTSESASSAHSWATVGKGNKQVIDIAPKKTAPKPFILLNPHGQRLDADLPKMNPSAEQRFEDRRRESGNFCNQYHLSGTCSAGEFCEYEHGVQLSPGERLVLLYKSRGILCPQRSACRNFHCKLGHHCKWKENCRLEECWHHSMHGLDYTPFKKVFEDGTEVRV